eukprot:1157805-Pelagomonas_calceolata.AAC.14
MGSLQTTPNCVSVLMSAEDDEAAAPSEGRGWADPAAGASEMRQLDCLTIQHRATGSTAFHV